MAVGKSSRTPFKHWLLNAELGRLCGIFGHPATASKVPAVACPFHIVDLCAGDGEVTQDNNSSPMICLKHADYAASRDVEVKVTLIEKSPNTFEQLSENVNRFWMGRADDERSRYFLESETILGDARDFVVVPQRPKQAFFVHSDPNSIADWPMSPEFVDSLTDTTTMLCTLGCNVGGLKRLNRDARESWFEHVETATSRLPSWHDAVLITLDGDKAQWAYLLRLPTKWTDQTCTNIIRVGSKYAGYDLTVASMRDSIANFLDMQRKLFLTKKELA